MELERGPLGADAGHARRQVVGEGPIHAGEFLARQRCGGGEVGEVSEQEAKRVAHLAVGVRHAVEDFVAHAHVCAPVGGERPPPHHVRAVLLDQRQRAHDVAERLVHGPAGGVQHPAVRCHQRERRLALDAHAHHERGVEPAAMLIRPLEVEHLGLAPARELPRRLELGVRHLERAVRAAGVEPHVEHVLFLPERARRAARGAAEARGKEVLHRLLVPHVGIGGAHEPRRPRHDTRVQRRLAAGLAVDRGDPHAPCALARQAPIRPVLHRVADPVARGGRVPAHRVLHAIETAVPVPVVVHDHEPLVGGAEDHGIAAAPAVRVAVGDAPRVQQHAVRSQPGDDVVVDLEHAPARELGHLAREPAPLVHGAEDAEAAPLAHGEILGAVPGRRVNDAGSILHAHERRPVHDARVVAERRAEDRAHEIGPAHGRHRLGRAAQPLAERREPRPREQQQLAAETRHHVLGLRVDHQPEIGRQRPRRRRPRHGGKPRPAREGARGRVLSEREAHEQAGGGDVGVLDLGHGERRAVRGTPMDGPFATLDEAPLVEPAERLQDLRLEAGGHREIGALPVAPDAQPDEFLALDVDPAIRVGAAGPAQLQPRGPVLLGRELLADLRLDRHAVVVPARHVGRVESLERRLPDRGVLPDLVRGRAHVEVVVRVGRAVVQEPQRPALPPLAHARVCVGLLPRLEALWFAAGQVRLHREGGLGHVERVPVSRFLLRVRHGSSCAARAIERRRRGPRGRERRLGARKSKPRRGRAASSVGSHPFGATGVALPPDFARPSRDSPRGARGSRPFHGGHPVPALPRHESRRFFRRAQG